jgi:ABC-type multidrug transport system ATPase subunit
VKGSEISQAVEGMIEMMCLEAHQHTKAENLSGGNRRKLSTSIAMIGAPSVVLLDEPSTGIDVGARRFLWTFLGKATQRGHALVLTSHSMEECEVLCSRLSIMVAGSFHCLGTPIQLKNRYGNGYTLTIKSQVNADTEAIEVPADKIKQYVLRELPTAVLSEEHVGLLRFRITKSDVQSIQASVKDAFSAMEAAVGGKTTAEGNLSSAVSDYTLSQTSLEEVFLHFSQHA